MHRLAPVIIIAPLLAWCARRCDGDERSKLVTSSEQPVRTPGADESRTPVTKMDDIGSVNPQGGARQELIAVTRTSCMAPCGVQLDAQKAAELSWAEVRDSEYVWDFDNGGSRTDSEGFLAAVAYEKAGTYHPTVTVDGETWDPRRSRCSTPRERYALARTFLTAQALRAGIILRPSLAL